MVVFLLTFFAKYMDIIIDRFTLGRYLFFISYRRELHSGVDSKQRQYLSRE